MGRSPTQPAPSSPGNADVFGPGYFISYARVPPLRGDRTDPHYWEKKFFHDLSAETRLVDDGLRNGFIADHVPPGSDPRTVTARNIASCRIFVPLCSDGFFEDEQCGREWAVFEQRRELRRARTGDGGESIVPVLWRPPTRGQWPDLALSPPPERSPGTDLYPRLGMYELIRLHERAYRAALVRLAEHIVLRAHTEAPPVTTEDSLSMAAPAFPRHNRSPHRLFITVVADTRRTAPSDRSPEYYGDQPEEWRPYHPEESEPLALRAARIARSLGYRPEVGVLSATSPEAKIGHQTAQDPQYRQPPAASIVLADPWHFRGYRERRYLETVDQRRKEWVRLMVPWCASDAETADRRTSLESFVQDAVPWMTQGWRRTCPRALHDLASAEEFDDALPAVIDRARSHFLNGSRPLRDASLKHYSSRPRLAPPPEDEPPRAGPG